MIEMKQNAIFLAEAASIQPFVVCVCVCVCVCECVSVRVCVRACSSS